MLGSWGVVSVWWLETTFMSHQSCCIAVTWEWVHEEQLLIVMQCFWFVPTGDLWRVDYQRQEEQPEDAIPNGTPEVTAMDGTHSHSPLDCIQAILFYSIQCVPCGLAKCLCGASLIVCHGSGS